MFMKQAKFLLSTPDQSQKCVYISESGTITCEVLPMETGYMTAANLHKTWKVEHNLKIQMKNEKGVLEDESVLMISDRDYLPLDPFEKITDEEREAMKPLKDIAKINHAVARSKMGGEGDDPRTRLFNTVTIWSWVIAGLSIAVSWIGG